MKKVFVALLSLCLFGSAFALESFTSLEWENDGKGFNLVDTDDKWFTNGIRFSYGLPIFADNGSAGTQTMRLGANLGLESTNGERAKFKFGDAASLDLEGGARWIVFEAAQSMYTPVEIEPVEPQYDDRPYAGWTRIGWKVQTRTEKRLNYYGFTIGMLGEAGAGATQTIIHRFVPGARHPGGWSTHVKDRLAIQASYSDRVYWTPTFTECIKGKEKENRNFWPKTDWTMLQLTSGYEIQLGNVFIGATYNPTLRFGAFRPDYRDNTVIPKLDKKQGEGNGQPADSSSGEASDVEAPKEGKPKDEAAGKGDDVKRYFFELSFFISPSINARAYDGTLDHQTDPGYRITPVPLQASLEAGFQFDLVNTEALQGASKCPFRRISFRWSPVYFMSPNFAVDYYWPDTDISQFIPTNYNWLGRWVVFGSWEG